MTIQELIDVRDLLLKVRVNELDDTHRNLLTESLRVVNRDINLKTTNYVTGNKLPGFKVGNNGTEFETGRQG